MIRSNSRVKNVRRLQVPFSQVDTIKLDFSRSNDSPIITRPSWSLNACSLGWRVPLHKTKPASPRLNPVSNPSTNACTRASRLLTTTSRLSSNAESEVTSGVSDPRSAAVTCQHRCKSRTRVQNLLNPRVPIMPFSAPPISRSKSSTRAAKAASV